MNAAEASILINMRDEAIPTMLHDRKIPRAIQQAVANAPSDCINKKRRAGYLRVRIVRGIKKAGAPESIVSLERLYFFGHSSKSLYVEWSTRIIGGQERQHSYQTPHHPAISP